MTADDDARLWAGADPSPTGPPRNPRQGRQRYLVWYLQALLVVALVDAALALVLPEAVRPTAGTAMVVLLVGAPLSRIAWLGLRWVRVRDWRFAALALLLLAIVATGLLLR